MIRKLATVFTADHNISIPGVSKHGEADWISEDVYSKLVKVRTVAGIEHNLWEGGLQDEKPVTLLGRPVYISTLMPEKAPDNVAIAFGDFGYYWIGERGNMSVKRLNEKYADTGMVGFRVTHRVDSKLVLPEAIKTIKYK